MRNSGDIAGDLSKGTLISILVSSSPMIEDVFVLIPISLLAPQAFQGHESVYARLQIALGSNCPDTAGWLILLIFASLFCSFLFHLWSEAVAQALKNEDKWLGCKEWQEGVTNRGWTAEPFVSVRPIAAGNSQNQPSWLAKKYIRIKFVCNVPQWSTAKCPLGARGVLAAQSAAQAKPPGPGPSSGLSPMEGWEWKNGNFGMPWFDVGWQRSPQLTWWSQVSCPDLRQHRTCTGRSELCSRDATSSPRFGTRHHKSALRGRFQIFKFWNIHYLTNCRNWNAAARQVQREQEEAGEREVRGARQPQGLRSGGGEHGQVSFQDVSQQLSNETESTRYCVVFKVDKAMSGCRRSKETEALRRGEFPQIRAMYYKKEGVYYKIHAV